MIKKLLSISLITLVLSLTFGGGVVFATDPPATPAPSLFSGSKDAACGGAQASDNPVTCDTTGSANTINELIKTGLNTLSILIGVVSVIMVMIGGFRFVTSQGEAANTAAARNTILYALVGLAVTGLAQLLVHFVLNRVAPQNVPPPKAMIQTVKSLEVS